MKWKLGLKKSLINYLHKISAGFFAFYYLLLLYDDSGERMFLSAASILPFLHLKKRERRERKKGISYWSHYENNFEGQKAEVMVVCIQIDISS